MYMYVVACPFVGEVPDGLRDEVLGAPLLLDLRLPDATATTPAAGGAAAHADHAKGAVGANQWRVKLHVFDVVGSHRHCRVCLQQADFFGLIVRVPETKETLEHGGRFL